MKEFVSMNDLIKVKGDTERYIIIEEFPDIDYVLVYRDTTYQPWVAAWLYDKEKQTWQQGHYFCKFEDAVTHIFDKQIAKKLNAA